MTGPILPGESLAMVRAIPSPAPTAAMLPFEEILAHLSYLRCYVWDAEPSDATLAELAVDMLNNVSSADQIEAWLM